MRERVKVAERDEGAHLEADGPGVIPALREPPRHAHGVLAVRHEDLLLEDEAFHDPYERRERVHPEVRQEAKAFGMSGSREEVRREVDAPAAHEERLLDFRQEHGAANGGLRRGHEQAVIPARVLAGDGRHRVPAEAVRFEPLALVGLARSGGHSPLCSSSFATSQVQPVWWLAPIPAPMSPWK